MERHRDELEVPRPAEVGGDHLQGRMGGGDGVEVDGAGGVEAQPLAAGLARPDAAGAGVEERNEAETLARVPDRPVALVVGRERLHRRMELHAPEPERLDPLHLGDRGLALVGVDAAEADEGGRMALAGVGDHLVGDPGTAGRRLRVPGEQDRDGVEGGVLGGELVDGAADDGGAEVALRRLGVPGHAAVEPLLGGQVDVEVDGAHAAG